MIQFGTSGWRSLIADNFTFENVRRAVQGIARYWISQGVDKNQPVIVGHDTRFLSPEFAQMAADILARYGFHVLITKSFVPTPVVSFQVTHQKALGSINFTASHNPAEYNGLKFNLADGASAPVDVTKEIERLANEAEQPAIPPTQSASIRSFDPRPAYLSKLKKIVNGSLLRKSKMRVGIDVLYGTGMGYLDTYFKELGLPTIVLHDWRDVRFGGDSPEPGETQLQELKKVVRTKKCAVGFGTDGDADRFGIMDQDGSLLTPNEILPILLQHLVKTRKWKGFVARSVMTSHFLDAVAKHYGLEVKETPVGFKYIAKAMKDSAFVMGGEESGGFTIRGHVPEKDGVLACALMAEVRALEKKSFRQILKELQKKVGFFLTDRINFHLSAEHMARLQKHLQTYTPSEIGGKRVHQIVRMDGYKFVFEDQSWMGIRLSGTEPVVRLYLEASTQKKLKQIREIGERLIQSEMKN